MDFLNTLNRLRTYREFTLSVIKIYPLYVYLPFCNKKNVHSQLTLI